MHPKEKPKHTLLILLLVGIPVFFSIGAVLQKSQSDVDNIKNRLSMRQQNDLKKKTNQPTRLNQLAPQEVRLYNDVFSFYYPTHWTITDKSTEYDKMLYLEPTEKGNAIDPRITLSVFDTRHQPAKTLTATYTSFEYEVTAKTVSGFEAKRYERVTPTDQGMHHTIAYIFPVFSKLYALELQYIQNDTNRTLEGEFEQFIASFSLPYTP